MATFKKQQGYAAEEQACDYLLHQGLQFVEKNFSCRAGEIDLIMKDNDTLVFVEVRMRQPNDYASALESISKSKQKKVIRAATFYLQQQDAFDKVNCRFDVVALTKESDRLIFDWIRNAFSVGFV